MFAGVQDRCFLTRQYKIECMCGSKYISRLVSCSLYSPWTSALKWIRQRSFIKVSLLRPSVRLSELSSGFSCASVFLYTCPCCMFCTIPKFVQLWQNYFSFSNAFLIHFMRSALWAQFLREISPQHQTASPLIRSFAVYMPKWTCYLNRCCDGLRYHCLPISRQIVDNGLSKTYRFNTKYYIVLCSITISVYPILAASVRIAITNLFVESCVTKALPINKYAVAALESVLRFFIPMCYLTFINFVMIRQLRKQKLIAFLPPSSVNRLPDHPSKYCSSLQHALFLNVFYLSR